MLTGRDAETRLLDRILVDARGGSSAVLALVGEVGAGKSTLLDHVDRMATGMRVLRARGVQSEARIPFSGLFELLRPALHRLDGVSEPQRDALESALALRPAHAHDRFAIGAATLSLLAAFADEEPVLILVDDAQWIDGSSADALRFAFRRLVADPVAVIIGVRENEPSLIDGTDIPVHQLAGLDRAATAALLASRVRPTVPISDDIIDRLHQATGGNPLALIELADEGTALSTLSPLDPPLSVVTRIGRVYLERSEALPERARDVLLMIAASDTDDLTLLARAAAGASLSIDDIRHGEAIGLVSVAGDRVTFHHPLVRSAVYAAAPPDRRRAMHRALAVALPDAEADRRAWHLALASLGPDDAASSAVEQAAERARSRSAYDVSSHAYERAASLSVDPGRRRALLLAAADAAWVGGLARRAVALLDQARGETATVELAVEHLRGHIATRLGPVSDGRRILLDAATTAGDTDPDRAVVMLAEAVNAAFYAGDAAAMQQAATRIDRFVGPDSSPRARFFAATAQGMALIFGADADGHGASLVRDGLAVVEASDDLADDARLLVWAAMATLWLRESEAGRTVIERAVEVARRQSIVGVLPFLLSHIGVDEQASDRWAEAEASFHEAIDLARATGQQTDLAMALVRLGWMEARQGKAADCRRHVDEARRLARDLDLGLAEIWSFSALGDLELGQGNLDAASGYFEAQQATLDLRGVRDVDLSSAPELIELDLRQGRRAEACARLRTFEAAATAKGQPWALARAARCRGLLAAEDDFDRHFAGALSCHRVTLDVFETACTQLAYGGRLRRSRQRSRSREQLRAALSTFDRLEAAPWADFASAELAATGETARRRDASARDHLSPQELQIALLLAGGRTTREAAAALFLSPKTIEYHLRSIYRKLAVNSRPELAAAVASRGPLTPA